MKRSRNTERPRGSTALPSRSNSMMSSALTSAGASDRDIRKRFGLVGWRALTWPKPSTTPKSARMRLPTTISSIKAGSPTGAVPPAVCACVCVKPDSSAKIAATPKRASVLVICRLPNLLLQNSLECAAQGFVAEHKAVAQRLVREHTLAAQQKFVGKVAAELLLGGQRV